MIPGILALWVQENVPWGMFWNSFPFIFLESSCNFVVVANTVQRALTMPDLGTKNQKIKSGKFGKSQKLELQNNGIYPKTAQQNTCMQKMWLA